MQNKTLADVFNGHDLEFMLIDLQGIKDELTLWLEGGEVDPDSLEYIKMLFTSLAAQFSPHDEQIDE